jgi:hypothetical protein
MSWHFSQALVAAFSAASCSDGELSAPSKTTPTHGMFWSPDRTMDASPRSRSGMTYELSTGDPGLEKWMSSLAASPVRTSAQQEAGRESTGNAPASGRNSHGSFVKFDPDTLSWRTRQCSLLGDSDVFLETWPPAGEMRGGMCWERLTQAPRTGESESGSFPTPVKYDSTPGGPGNHYKGLGWMGKHSFPTIRSTDGERGGRGDLIQAVRGNPNTHFKLWPTPNVCGGGNPPGLLIQNGNHFVRRSGVKAHLGLDWKGSSKAGQRRGQLTDPAMGVIAPGGQLNPQFVEWLMGWPANWTSTEPLPRATWVAWLTAFRVESIDCDASETGRCQRSQDLRGGH